MREAQKRIEDAQQSGYANIHKKGGKGKKGRGGNSSPSGSQNPAAQGKKGRRGGGGSLEGSDVEASDDDGGSFVSGGGYGSGSGSDASLAQEDYEAMLAAMGYERRREHLKETALARRRRGEERARMIIEDDRSKTMRSEGIIADALLKQQQGGKTTIRTTLAIVLPS